MRRNHEPEGAFKQDAEGNETVTERPSPAPGPEPEKRPHLHCLYMNPCFQHCAPLQKPDDSLNISLSKIIFIHPRIINPQSTKFFEKK